MKKSFKVYKDLGSFWEGPPLPTLSAADIALGSWRETTSHLIFPGGRDRPYHEALKGKGNAQIRAFVAEGGIYLGFCAGAYYGSAKICFDEGTPLEVIAPRELAFFSGTAVGPAFGRGTFEYGSQKGARAAALITSLGIFDAYHNGGCFFEGDFSNVSILARYRDLPGQPPAILEIPIGRGKAILSGAHIEIPLASLSSKDPLRATLNASEPMRQKFWKLLTELT
jgi:glutamine amidotransferase-like uncharacterized protein